jgi:hypothetical protein
VEILLAERNREVVCLIHIHKPYVAFHSKPEMSADVIPDTWLERKIEVFYLIITIQLGIRTVNPIFMIRIVDYAE